ncbi:MAG: GNAT family N-acetyltransferase [Rhodanobacteraceae bacterium]
MNLDDIRHDAVAQRFEMIVEGHACVLDYRLADGIMTITHTRVPAAVGNRGIAAALTRNALETARASGWRAVAACSYAAAYIRRHPEYADLAS